MTDATHTPTSGTPLRHLPGHFYYADLHTTDVDGALGFYRELFGWTIDDIPGAPQRYCPASIDDRGKAAITGLSDEQRAAGTEPYWFPYLWVDDVDAAVARVRELGGAVVHEAVDVFDLGRMAVVEDPTGAGFGLWQDHGPEGGTVMDEHGSPFWYELHATDVDAALDFYGGLVGWVGTRLDMGGGMAYTTVAIPGEDDPLQVSAGGVMTQMQADRDAGLPSTWFVYFHVEDCDAAFARAQELGATAVMEPHDIPGAGRSCWLRDPQGAIFAAMTPDPRS